jgi:hypothetical protein
MFFRRTSNAQKTTFQSSSKALPLEEPKTRRIFRFNETVTSPSPVSVVVRLYLFSNATFTPGGQTGRFGPSLAQARSGLSGPEADTWKNNTEFFNTSNGIQLWTVPENGTYRIETWGAQGGTLTGSQGGFGARMRGDFNLSKGEVIKILVGQTGSLTYGGGGGGTFVTKIDNTPLIVSGGGNPTSPWSGTVRHATTSTTGVSSSAYSGGSNGNGGFSNAGAYGGAGLLSDAQGSDSCNATRPQAFINSGIGGESCNGFGGFGGGSATDGCCFGASGAGGGYSGGGGTSSSSQFGGAGGSINTGTNQSNDSGNAGTATLSGNGRVIITAL